jgi:hypothetical protein
VVVVVERRKWMRWGRTVERRKRRRRYCGWISSCPWSIKRMREGGHNKLGQRASKEWMERNMLNECSDAVQLIVLMEVKGLGEEEVREGRN